MKLLMSDVELRLHESLSLLRKKTGYLCFIVAVGFWDQEYYTFYQMYQLIR